MAVKQPVPKARFGARAQATSRASDSQRLEGSQNGESVHEPLFPEGAGAHEDAHMAHLLPKVMAPYETKPGDTPRRVQIQRKRKLFAQQDLPRLIELEGQHGPGHSVFRLDIFDDTDFESRLSSEWVPKTPGVAPTPAKTAVLGPDGTVIWADCTVIDYDEARNRYAVVIKNSALAEAAAKASGQTLAPTNGDTPHTVTDETALWVARVNLCFSAEDPFVFARRHADAHASRGRAESLLRYNLYIDCMPTEDIPPLSTEQVNRMLNFALNSKKLRDKLMDTNALLSEVNMEYARSLNKITFDSSLKRGHSGCMAALVPIVEEFPQERRVKARYTGCVPVAEYDFAQQFSDFSFRTLLTKSEVISALMRVRVECFKAMKMSLFNTYFTKSLRLEEFEQGQNQTTDQTANYLKDTWVVTLKNNIKSSFKDVGKGWFNLHETNMETYEFSKLKKFLTQVKFMMEDTLRFLVEDSLQRLVSFVCTACLQKATVKSTACVEVEMPAMGNQPAYITNGNVSTLNTASVRKPPLLLLELQATKDSSRFQYSTSLDAIVPRFCAVYDSSLNKVSGIPVIEPAVMEELFWAIVPQLTTVHPMEDWVVKGREELAAHISAALVPVQEYLSLYDVYEPLLKLSPEAYVAALEAKGEDLALAEVKSEIKKNTQELNVLYDALPNGMAIGGLVYVNTQKVRELLLKKKEKLVTLLRNLCARVPRKMMAAVSAKFQEIERVLRQKPEKLEDVHEQRKYINGLSQAMSALMQDIESTKPWYDYLENQRYQLSDEEAKDKFLGVSWPNKLARLADRQMGALAEDESKFRDEMISDQDAFQDNLGELSALVNSAAQHTDLNKMDTIVNEVKRLDERLRKAESDAQLFNAREGLLGLPITDYSHVRNLIELFDPFLQFWTTSATWRANFKSWMNDSWEKLNGEFVETSVSNASKVLFKTGKVLQQRGLEKFAANCETMRQEVDSFKRLVPLVLAIRNPGMRQRHWESISKEIGTPLYPDKKFNLNKAEEMGLLNHLPVISRVSDVAGKEYSIEQALDKMVSEWEGAELIVMDYRDSGTYIIKVEENISQMLDDHIVMSQSMSFSQFKKPFEERISKWEMQLSLASDILEQWVALQRQWMYLEPIFSSEDIMQQLPLETKRFAAVDRIWRKTLEGAKRNPLVLKVCGNQKLLDQFIEGNKLLESVQKGLADYLETKRLAFARFFFLSNDELLQILSQTKNPLAVQPHLRKCFEAIESLDFKEDLEITAMNSKEKEKVPFNETMYPKGNVEHWLGLVEQRMRSSVRHQIIESMKDAMVSERPTWARSWPAMVVLAVSAIIWSKDVEDAIKAQSVPSYFEKVNNDLLDLTDLVRGKLSTQDRLTLGALITTDVHARDTVQELVDVKIQRTSDFEWISRMRMYWRDDVFVEMVQACIPYGYEYLGNTPRLVITPLTDRCYMTLMSAMHLNLGGAPAGPAGTGKTETVKDLAKALAKQCVVFNCSDGLDYIAMGKFFKGLASAGAWACFDEFNRIDLEVLSVVAQQILTIQLAIQAKVKRFIFEDTEIDLNFSCSVYITMNPGYAGRSELPDNLKALFRPCAMMVPDYALIGEISLYSYGFKDGKNLARKMVATFKLCSEQLSSQDHYDYGMRAVKSVITAAGNLKRDFPSQSEDVLLLRALRDVNYPKFLSHDLPLFNGIISDLFPGVVPPEVDYNLLLSGLNQACSEMNIQPVQPFVDKVIQLYETTIVRHGLMLVGPTMGGKTCCHRSLQKGLTMLNSGHPDKYEKVRTVTLNPKAVTLGQLYGEFDDMTHEWTDGVLACYMRECSEDTKPDKKWIMFDGPVDAVWIENMNTVLDDNKKLCLVSGEIIQLSSSMTMMFEVEDLAVASPATVSRCGMVFMEPSQLGTEPLLTSWLQRLPPDIQKHSELLAAMFNALVPEGLSFIRKSLRETVATVDNNLVSSCLNIMDALLMPWWREQGKDPLSASEQETLGRILPSLFLFSVVWSLGASCDKQGRNLFDRWLHEMVAVSSVELLEGAMPPKGTSVYEYCFDQQSGEWVEWMSTIPEFQCDPDKPFSEIIVPTSDTVRYTYLIDNLLAAGKHVLCVGDTGTGKTLNVANKLLHQMPEEVLPVFLTFSARTSANQTQDIIDSKMEKKRKGVFGPPSGKKFVMFVDDLNMPAREKYFAQPPIELLRQWFDHGGWYERKPPCPFRQIIDTQFVGSMGPPGGGRNPVTNRLLRHFNFISFTEMSDESVNRIFTTILGAFFKRYFNESIQGMCQSLLAATVQMYNTIRAEMLPTPSKSHYTFNLRDLAKVVQGCMRADAKSTSDRKQVLSLWLHECSRVFEDRLNNKADHDWFRAQQEKLLEVHFQLKYQDIVPGGRLIYGDFLVPGADPKVYKQITDMEHLVKVVEEYLEDYNSMSNTPMKLVMFLDAIEHVSRITRVMRLPQGNALLLGVGGSGRQSLTRLAAFMEDYEVYQIEVAKGYGSHEWREDLKRVLMKCGIDGKELVFLFADTQIVQEAFLEDINNILNSGEVPNLFQNDDLEVISNAMRPILMKDGIPVTKTAIYSLFVNRVRSLLHLVLCFSPIGDAFRQRLRMFPSLVNCCTIDWFQEWPQEALRNVAISFFSEVELSSEAHPQLLEGVVDSCVFVHQSVERWSKTFHDQLRRYNYVTPTSYLELLGTFIRLLGEKRNEINNGRRRLEVGLQKLLSTAAQVEVMQRELKGLQPILARTSQEVEDMMVVITNDKKEADETKKIVEQQEKEANVQAAHAKEIADSAQRDLDEALPALSSAVASLKNLSKSDAVEVKTMFNQNPPQGVKLVMEAAAIMFDEKPNYIPDPNKLGKKITVYTDAGKRLLSEPEKFLRSLVDYDKDNISDGIIKKIEPYMLMEEFTPDAVSKVSKACTSICMWVRAMYVYHNVALQVAPKRESLAKAQDELSATMGQLANAQAKLKAVEEKMEVLQAQYVEAMGKKEGLAKQVHECTVKLQRADKLIGGLGGERVRWQATVDQLTKDLVNVVGDVVIAAGSIAYSGPFTPVFRANLLSEWTTHLHKNAVPHSEGSSLIRTLQDPVKVRAWAISGLPTDNLSIENAIIVSKARRWPLMIDPQGQANKWIKNMERDSGLDVIKLSDKDFLRTLENGVRFGRAVLLENVGETLEAALEPLLLKQTFKQGGSEVIKIGDNIIPYHSDFKFYMTTKLRNPHYAPEVAVKVSLLNFFVTTEGLEEQLLGTVVTQERPDLANLKSQLTVNNARMKKELQDIEDKILHMLSNSKGNILEDEELINTLAQSKITSNEISAKVAEAEITEKQIDETREQYRPVAVRASLLFFCISDLAMVDPMYQYSLAWFISLFIRSIEEAEKCADIQERGNSLNSYFTYSLYVIVCRSLFEQHKLMFSLLLAIKILQNQNMINPSEWRFMLAGATSTEMKYPNPAPEWLTDKSWIEILNLSNLRNFQGFASHFSQHLDHYKALFDSNDAHEFPLTQPWNDVLTPFQKICFLRCIRPDKVIMGIQSFVSHYLGNRFVEPPPFDLHQSFKESAPATPLIFVLSPGADPMADLLKLAEEMKFSKKFEKVSLGQGQGPKAERLLEFGMDRGIWVCLQNCHLAVSWMPTLERIVENIEPDKVHKDFRLWLTSMPSPDFPVTILQDGIKMTLEPPKGLKSNLLRSYNRFTDSYLMNCSKPQEWRALTFGLCLFHAVIQDRRKLGPLGWNIRYDFTDGDLGVSLAQMKEYLDLYEEIPFKVLRFLITEINYGGRVTDDKDRRLMNNLVNNFLGPDVLHPGYKFSPSGTYVTPDCATVKEYWAHISSYPMVPRPEIFGLHDNADITCDQNETYSMFATVLSLQPREAASQGQSQEEIIADLAQQILAKLPRQFDIEEVCTRFPTTYRESMNTVLTQECHRYNGLLAVMDRSLKETVKAVKGLVVMSPELEGVVRSMYDNQVPDMWASKAYPSLKPLSSWVNDLLDRCRFIQSWVDKGTPNVYWIPGFFFPQAFLTGTMQNYARKHAYAIDTVSFSFHIMDQTQPESVEFPPEEGCYIKGLFMEGARWDCETHVLADSRPKELYTDCPMVWLKPERHRKKPISGIYDCPVYKTLTRAGSLSTTGHSTNFIMFLELPTDKDQGFWINRGVALFTSLAF